jgi:chromatin remodeling complex protein RSC6
MRITNEMVFNQLQIVLAKLSAIEQKLGIEQTEEQIQEQIPKPIVVEKEKKPRKPRKPKIIKNPYCHEYKISPELSNFMNSGDKPRQHKHIMKCITTYIKTKKLYDKKNPKNIKLDKNLEKIFKLKNSEQLTYFNLQHYLKPHFIEQLPKPEPEPEVPKQDDEEKQEEEKQEEEKQENLIEI